MKTSPVMPNLSEYQKHKEMIERQIIAFGRHKPIDLKVAEQTFLDVKKIIDQAGIKFWLNSGTALGAVRDEDFISWDIDVDLTVLAKEWNFPIMFKEFGSKGFRCVKKIYPKLYKDKPLGVVIFRQGIQTDIDLNYYYPPEDLIISLPVEPHDHGTLQPAKFYRGNHFIDFLNTKVRVPYPPEEYFELYYGMNWKTPIKDWSWLRLREPISIAKYVEYFHEHPEINQKVKK